MSERLTGSAPVASRIGAGLLTAAIAWFAGVSCLASAESAVSPEWPAGVGSEEIVLPGFSPVATWGTTVRLAERSYAWNQSYLPERIVSRGDALTGPLRLEARISNRELELTPNAVEVVEATDHHAVIRARGTPIPGLTVLTETRIEYDGVAMVTLTLEPESPVRLDGLDFTVDVSANSYTRMLAFAATNIRGQSRRIRIEPKHRGDFLNVIGLADGERSFWWFADDAEGWIWNGDTVTEVGPVGSSIRVRQRLIGDRFTIDTPMRFQFNFLATPVRHLGTQWRSERLVGAATPAWAGLGRLHLWWDSAFAHVLLPYTSHPASVREQIPEQDLRAYPGIEENRRKLRQWRRKLGIERIPYFSAHAINALDPVLIRHRKEWEVEPPFVNKTRFQGRDSVFEKPYLSHRAEGYQDYVVSRLAEELERLGAQGIYLDQGDIIDSRNPAHGGWVDSRGNRQPSLDILGMRRFLKRLRVMLHTMDRAGYVFIHNSLSEIVPAYTFASGTVDGEQFRHHLNSDDYIGSISLDQARLQFAPGQYGVLNFWLPQFFYFHRGKTGWEGSQAQRRATRNFLSLTLLNDVPVWPSSLHMDEWRTLIQDLDRFGVDRAEFIGYWQGDVGLRASNRAVRASRYARPERSLAVISNLGAASQRVSLELDPVALGLKAPIRALDRNGRPLASGTRLELVIPERDFVLVTLESEAPESG